MLHFSNKSTTIYTKSYLPFCTTLKWFIELSWQVFILNMGWLKLKKKLK